jgi:hypothetical protein
MHIAPAAEWTDADHKVAAWAAGALRAWGGHLDSHPSLSVEHTAGQRQRSDHLRRCPTLRVVSFGGSDGTYGCDTGCEYLRIEGQVVCDHDAEGAEFWVGEFGELVDFLADLDRR